MGRLVGYGRRLVRWVLGGAGPLRRGSDRFEAGVRLLVVIAVLAAAPVGVVVGSAVHTHDSALAARHARESHLVHAAVLADPPVPDGTAPGTLVNAVVGWTPPDGQQRTATVAVPAGTQAEDRVPVWIGPNQRPTTPPISEQDVRGGAVWSGALAGLGLPLAAGLLLVLARGVLDARRARQWQIEWLAVEPVWTSRRR